MFATRIAMQKARGVKNRSPSSSRWLQRQKKDPFVAQAKRDDYRARSAYKLIHLDDKYHIFKRKSIAVDLGACPGAWSQVASERIGTNQFTVNELGTWNHGLVLAVDKEVMKELPGVFIIDRADVTSANTHKRITDFLSGHQADVVMSDMAPNASGMQALDHQRIMELGLAAFELSRKCLKTNGTFICKLWDGALLNGFKKELRECFESVQEVRSQATRKESAEMYLVAQHYVCTDTQSLS